MGINERKERERERRRNEILDAAETVFFEKGAKNATMDDVAEAAELSKGTLYLYFKSREEVYLALSLRGLSLMNDMFQKAIQGQQKGIDKVRAIGRAYYDFTQKYPGYHEALIFWESQEHDIQNPESEAYSCVNVGDDSFDVLVQAIQGGMADGSMRPDLDPMQTALTLWGATMGLVQLTATKGHHLESCHNVRTDGLVEYAFELVLRSLQPEGQSQKEAT